MTLLSRNKWVIFGVVLGAILLIVIALRLSQKTLPKLVSGPAKTSDNLTIVKENSKAVFPYLVPKADSAWQFDASSTLFDQTKGVVKYNLILKQGNSKVTISQQKLPDELKPVPNSAKFNQFIIASNVNYSVSIGAGKAYFRVAQQNGAPASGATTVIFATNDVLLFGQSGTILSYDEWSKILGGMQLSGAR